MQIAFATEVNTLILDGNIRIKALQINSSPQK